MKKQKNYDKKVKQTRILLGDYILLKGIAQRAGVSMSEALHTIITRDWALARSHKILTPVTTARSTPVDLSRSTPVDLSRRRSTPVSVSFSREVKANDYGQNTNGHRQAD